MLRSTSFWTAPFRHPPRRRSTRWVIRATLATLGRFVDDVTGADRLRGHDGPFVAVLNHNQQVEAFLVPALLAWLRGGRIIRFLADWNFMLLPPVYVLYKSARIIPVTAKAARPRFLTPLRDIIAPGLTGYDAARRCLQEGRPVGFFPEGTTNRNPNRLLRGHTGAARLSMESQCPVLPIGIRFPQHDDPTRPISDWEPLSVHVGDPMMPPVCTGEGSASRLTDWHADVMRAVGALADKTWSRHHSRTALQHAH